MYAIHIRQIYQPSLPCPLPIITKSLCPLSAGPSPTVTNPSAHHMPAHRLQSLNPSAHCLPAHRLKPLNPSAHYWVAVQSACPSPITTNSRCPQSACPLPMMFACLLRLICVRRQDVDALALMLVYSRATSVLEACLCVCLRQTQPHANTAVAHYTGLDSSLIGRP